MLNYHDAEGSSQYEVPSELEREFYREFPKNASDAQHIEARGKWLTRAAEIIYDAILDGLSGSISKPNNDILYQIFKDYTAKKFIPGDFILAALDLVFKCQFNRVFDDRKGQCTMSTPKKSGLPTVAMRKALTAAADKMNPLVVKTLATAGPAYLRTRAAEAFAAEDHELALVLVAWSLCVDEPKGQDNCDQTIGPHNPYARSG